MPLQSGHQVLVRFSARLTTTGSADGLARVDEDVLPAGKCHQGRHTLTDIEEDDS